MKETWEVLAAHGPPFDANKHADLVVSKVREYEKDYVATDTD